MGFESRVSPVSVILGSGKDIIKDSKDSWLEVCVAMNFIKARTAHRVQAKSDQRIE